MGQVLVWSPGIYEKRKVYFVNGRKRRLKVNGEVMPDLEGEWQGLIKEVPVI